MGAAAGRLARGRALLGLALLGLYGGCLSCPWCGRPMPRTATEGGAEAPTVYAPVILHGSVTYLERVAMHPSADVEIRLYDVSAVHAAPVLVAERVLHRPDRVPVEFELSVESCRILSGHDYALTARVVVDGATLFATPSAFPVLTPGAPAVAQLILSRVQVDAPN